MARFTTTIRDRDTDRERYLIEGGREDKDVNN